MIKMAGKTADRQAHTHNQPWESIGGGGKAALFKHAAQEAHVWCGPTAEQRSEPGSPSFAPLLHLEVTEGLSSC